MDPTIVIGGVLEALGGSNVLGKGDYFVVEACEAFASFLHLNPAIAVVTNIDNDHLDHYQNMDNLKDAFVTFVNRLPFYGFALVCGDDQGVRDILPRFVRRYITYGFGDQNDYRVKVLEKEGMQTRFSVEKDGVELGQATLGMPGRHNVLNAVAALGIALELGMPFETAAGGLYQFSGVHRRFQKKGEAQGVTIVDDYAHHPTEVEATLNAARDSLGGNGRLIVAFQPHLFSRTKLLYKEFSAALNLADEIFLCGIYPARETAIPGVTSELIADCLEEKGKKVTYAYSLEGLLPKVLSGLKPGDLFVTVGAGTIDQLGDRVLEELKKQENLG